LNPFFSSKAFETGRATFAGAAAPAPPLVPAEDAFPLEEAVEFLGAMYEAILATRIKIPKIVPHVQTINLASLPSSAAGIGTPRCNSGGSGFGSSRDGSAVGGVGSSDGNDGVGGAVASFGASSGGGFGVAKEETFGSEQPAGVSLSAEIWTSGAFSGRANSAGGGFGSSRGGSGGGDFGNSRGNSGGSALGGTGGNSRGTAEEPLGFPLLVGASSSAGIWTSGAFSGLSITSRAVVIHPAILSQSFNQGQASSSNSLHFKASLATNFPQTFRTDPVHSSLLSPHKSLAARFGAPAHHLRP
jgi:hypothetical protein